MNLENCFCTGYNKDNLQISKQQGILGWKQNSRIRELRGGDYVFIYNIDSKKIDCLFQVNSRIPTTGFIWKDETESNTVKYVNRWNAKLIRDNLNIGKDQILNIYPFNKDPNSFNLFIKNPFPNYLNAKYKDFLSLLVTNDSTRELFASKEKTENPGDIHLSSIGYDYLVKYITEQHSNENYELVVIKTLIENQNGTTSHEIENQLHIYNPESANKSLTEKALSLLTNNNIIKKELDKYVLNIKNTLNKEEEDNILNLCNRKIKEFAKIPHIKFWKIAPGVSASLWEESRNNSIIAIGWNEIGDMKDKSIDEIHLDIKRKFPYNYYSIVSQVEDFISIKEGDIVLANIGISKIVGIGKVVGNYKFRPDLYLKHTYPVEWLDTSEREVPSLIGKGIKTVSSINSEQYQEIILADSQKKENIIADYNRNNGYDESTNILVSDLKTFENDKKLITLSIEEIESGYIEITKNLLVSIEKLTEILIALTAGRHILLAGPIGTGKTELARKIPEIFWGKKEEKGYLAEVHTATSDWSTQDVIGGIMPRMKNGNIVYEFQYGCALDTIQKNWQFGINGGSRIQPNSYKGIWLVIDEFNRADIDKAFGHLFTGLRTGSLKIPVQNGNSTFRDIIIPNDYRIICTLNTADKHFLYRLSDALKSRFAYIEIDIPSRKERDHEIYYAIKNAIEKIGWDDVKSLVDLDHENKMIIKETSDKDVYKQIYQAYVFLEFIRIFKKLGTAILQLIYQNILTGYRITRDAKQSLDFALISTLIPQLESLTEAEVGIIIAMFENKLVKFFQDKSSSHFREGYSTIFLLILEYLNLADNKELTSRCVKGNLNVEDIKQIDLAYERINDEFGKNLTSFREAINDEFGKNLTSFREAINDLAKSAIV